MTQTIKKAVGAEDFHKSFAVNANSTEAMHKIAQVNLWWAKNFNGKSTKFNDKFSVHFGDTWVDFKISEFVPGKKIVWLVTDCNLHWIENKKEWVGTEVVFELTEKEGRTKIDFSHRGLTSDCECFENCKPGWSHHLKNGLQKLINEGKGEPE